MCLQYFCLLKCFRAEAMDLWNQKSNSGAVKSSRAETAVPNKQSTVSTLLHCPACPASGQHAVYEKQLIEFHSFWVLVRV